MKLDATRHTPTPPLSWLLARWAASRSLSIEVDRRGAPALLAALGSAAAAPSLTQLCLVERRKAYQRPDIDVARLLTRLHPLLPALHELTAPVSALPALPAFSRLKHMHVSLPVQRLNNPGFERILPDLTEISCLPELISLDVAAEGRHNAEIACLDLRGMARLRVLTLRRVTPEGLVLRESVAVRLLGFCEPSILAEPVWQGVRVQHIEYYKSSRGAIYDIDLPSSIGTGHLESICIDGRQGGVGGDDFTHGARGLKCLCTPLLQHLQHLEVLTEGRVELLIPACMPLKSLVVMASYIYLDFEDLARFAEGVDRVQLTYDNRPFSRLQIPKEGPLEDRRARDWQHYGWKGIAAFTAALLATGVRISHFSERVQVLQEKPLKLEDRIMSFHIFENEVDLEEFSDAVDSEENKADDLDDPLEGTILLYERMHG